MAIPIKVIPTLKGKAGTLRDITKEPSYKLMKKLSSNILVL